MIYIASLLLLILNTAAIPMIIDVAMVIISIMVAKIYFPESLERAQVPESTPRNYNYHRKSKIPKSDDEFSSDEYDGRDYYDGYDDEEGIDDDEALYSDDDDVADQRAVWRKKLRHIRGFVRTVINMVGRKKVRYRFVRTVIGVFSACVGLTVVLRFIRTVANIIK